MALEGLCQEQETPSAGLAENVIDFRDNHVVFEALDLDLARVSSRDFTERNEPGKAIDALIRTQTEEYIDRAFSTNPDRYKGFLLADSDKDRHPVGQIFYVKHSPPSGKKYVIQPLYLIVHPDYRRKGLSKVLRLILLYDQLVREPSSANCELVCVIPASAARSRVYPFFEKLCPGIAAQGVNGSLLPRYELNSATIRKNLPAVLEEMRLRVVD